MINGNDPCYAWLTQRPLKGKCYKNLFLPIEPFNGENHVPLSAYSNILFYKDIRKQNLEGQWIRTEDLWFRRQLHFQLRLSLPLIEKELNRAHKFVVFQSYRIAYFECCSNPFLLQLKDVPMLETYKQLKLFAGLRVHFHSGATNL